MGIDFLDMTFRIEKRFKVRFAKGDWDPFLHSKPVKELTAGDVCDFLMPWFGSIGARPQEEWAVAPSRDGAPVLDYQGESPLDLKADVWVALQQILSEMLNIPINQISADSRLILDLGFT